MFTSIHQLLIAEMRDLLEAENNCTAVSKIKRNEAPCFPNLKVNISFELIMPFSNAAAERVFSLLKLIKTQNQNSLHNVRFSSLVHVKE